MRKVILTPEDALQGNLVLVNKEHPLKKPAAPDSLCTFLNSEILLEHKTALVLEHLFAAIGCGSKLIPVSGYRTSEQQRQIYASSLAEHGSDFTQKYVALPGCSEHQTGLAVDLALNRKPIDFIRPDFPEEGFCRIFRLKMDCYGFIERYPEGKRDITGIAPEPWHFRYVGLPHASLMRRHNFTLEEYLEYLCRFPYEGRHLKTEILNKSFEIFYRKAEKGSSLTEIPGVLPFQVSGTNTGGYIFTLWR